MPLSETFKAELSEAYKQLGETQRKLASLAGQADFEGLPSEIGVLLKRKNVVLGKVREDLHGVPARVAEAEVRR